MTGGTGKKEESIFLSIFPFSLVFLLLFSLHLQQLKVSFFCWTKLNHPRLFFLRDDEKWKGKEKKKKKKRKRRRRGRRRRKKKKMKKKTKKNLYTEAEEEKNRAK